MDQEHAEALRKPFPPEQIGKLPKPTKRDNKKGKCNECGGWHGLPAVHLDYAGHAAVTDRLLRVDPGWTWEPLGRDANGLPLLDSKGGLWINLTVCGVTRPGYGDETAGRGMKEIIGDALRNAAMRFGVALDLWSKQELAGVTSPEKQQPEDTMPATITDDQLGQIMDMILSTQTEEAKFLGFLKIEKMEHLLASNFGYAMGALKKKAEQMAEK